MKIYLFAIWLLFGVAKSALSQNIAVNWHFSRLLDLHAPSFVYGVEFNTPKSKNKTLQVSLGYGATTATESLNLSGREPFSVNTIRYGIEQKYFIDGQTWQGRYLSYAFEARHMQIQFEEWVSNCDSGNCFEEIQKQRQIKNAYNLMGRLGRIRRLGKIFYYDLFLGFGAKLAKKTRASDDLDLNSSYKISENHYLYPAFSLGFRVGFILK